jgi:hypothetical protein
MPDKKAMVGAAGAYLKDNPHEIVRAMKNALAMRVGLPIDALRWLAAQARGKRAPKNVRLEAVPPGIRASADVELAGTAVRASATVFVEDVNVNSEQARFELRLSDVKLELVDPSSDSPVATLLKSGALDLSKPGNLAAFMPKRPAMLVDAADDRIVLDLMKHPKFAQNGKLTKILSLVTPLVTVRGISTDPEHLDVQLKTFPDGVQEALAAVRAVL